MTTDHQPVAEVSHGRLRWHLPTPDADPAGRFLDNDTHPLYDQAALDAARMAGVRSVQEQTAVIVRAALELLESIEGSEPFTAEKMRAFKRVFGA